jgi:hypothetical protein
MGRMCMAHAGNFPVWAIVVIFERWAGLRLSMGRIEHDLGWAWAMLVTGSAGQGLGWACSGLYTF